MLPLLGDSWSTSVTLLSISLSVALIVVMCQAVKRKKRPDTDILKTWGSIAKELLTHAKEKGSKSKKTGRKT